MDLRYGTVYIPAKWQKCVSTGGSNTLQDRFYTLIFNSFIIKNVYSTVGCCDRSLYQNHKKAVDFKWKPYIIFFKMSLKIVHLNNFIMKMLTNYLYCLILILKCSYACKVVFENKHSILAFFHSYFKNYI